MDTFAKDIELMFDNALLYNDDASSVAQNAHVLKVCGWMSTEQFGEMIRTATIIISLVVDVLS